MKIFNTVLCLFMVSSLFAQDVKVEFDKTKDYSGYKTFRFGDSEIVTPKEKKQITDASLHKIIRESIEKELIEKGIVKDDSSTELVITYVAGIFEHSERQNLGPLGTAPGQSSQTWMNNYSQGELIIDINDIKSKKLIWRINSQTNTSTPEAQTYIEQVVDKGLKKFATKPKKAKKK